MSINIYPMGSERNEIRTGKCTWSVDLTRLDRVACLKCSARSFCSLADEELLPRLLPPRTFAPSAVSKLPRNATAAWKV